MWFIYFLETKKKETISLFFFLAITSKEKHRLATFLISFYIFVKERSKLSIFFMVMSITYVSFIFFLFFPHIIGVEYLYANKEGLFSNINPLSFFDTAEKRQVILYSLLTFGFLPLLAPLYLLTDNRKLSNLFYNCQPTAAVRKVYMDTIELFECLSVFSQRSMLLCKIQTG